MEVESPRTSSCRWSCSPTQLAVKWSKFVADLRKAGAFDIGLGEAMAYVSGFILLLTGYFVLSDGAASAVVTLAAAVQFIGLMMLTVKVVANDKLTADGRSLRTTGISCRTLQMLMMSLALRLSVNVWTDSHDGYLPMDKSGDWAFQAIEFLSLCLTFALVVFTTLQKGLDLNAWPCMLLCTMLAVFIHPSRNGDWSDIRWAASMYIEGFAMLPQLLLTRRAVQIAADERGDLKSNYAIDQEAGFRGMTSHFLACNFIASLLTCGWWVHMNSLLMSDEQPLAGYAVVAFTGMNCLVTLDFMYYYFVGLAQTVREAMAENVV